MSSAPSSRSSALTGGATRPPSFSLRGYVLASPWTYRLITLVVVATIWEAYASQARLLLVPTFSATIRGIAELIVDPETWRAFALSNQALVVGFVISVALGLLLGLAAARFRRVEGFLDPYLSILLVTPMAALIPILIMSLGVRSLAARVFLVVVFSIPVVIVNARAGVRQVDPGLIEMATSFGAREGEIWRKVLLPGALPAIMTGIRLGLGRAVTGMVIIELLMVSVGIGGLILDFQGQFEAGLLYGVVVLVVLEALILVSIVRVLERRVAPWTSDTVLRE